MRPAVLLAGLALLAAPGGPPAPPLLDACAYAARPDRHYQLPAFLKEISGLALVSPATVLAHDDERGILYRLDLATGEVSGRWPLRGVPADDFEGIALAGDAVYLYSSGGRLYRIAVPESAGEVSWTRTDTGLGRACEFEGLAWDPSAKVLLLPCKYPKGADKGVGLRIYRWDPAAGRLADPAVVDVSTGDLEAVGADRKFPASAIEVVPGSGHWLVLSGVGRALVELDAGHRPVAARRLKAREHRQPEGLTLAPDSTLVISDEAAGRRATLSTYRCHP